LHFGDNRFTGKYAVTGEIISPVKTTADIAKEVGVSERTVRQWTEVRRKDLEEERNRLIIDLYLKAENTQESIAERLNITQPTVTNIIGNFIKNGNLAEIYKNFTPYLYTIWTQNKQDKETSHFGAFPNIYWWNYSTSKNHRRYSKRGSRI
jgi:DNA-binding CsgD family transcriptional regulator